jgi:hypothetical protein
MASQTITITYLNSPTTTATAQVSVPAGIAPSQHVKNGFTQGGFWISASQFVAWPAILGISTP